MRRRTGCWRMAGVEGYLTIEAGAPKLTVRDDGLNQTILKSFLDQYLQISATAAHILERNPQAAQARAAHRFDGTAGVYPGNFPV